MAEDVISEQGRRTRFERWETLGLDRVKADLENGGSQVIGGPPAVRDLAWEWVRMKEAGKAAAVSPQKPTEILSLKPGAWGMNVDLKEAIRRGLRWWQGKRRA
jgi:hypothetical protein